MGEILPRNDETLQERMADFQHQYDQLMFWINYKEVIIWPEELKSVADNEVILREKYAKFNEEVAFQEPRVNEVIQLADSLIQSGHPEDVILMRRREELKQSWQRMRKLALKRQMFSKELDASQPPVESAAKPATVNQVAAEANALRGLLEDFLRLEKFEAECSVTKKFISQNLVIMTDQSHLDPSNMNLKVQNHKKLEEELFSRNNSVEIIIKIKTHLEEIIEQWEKLLEATSIKTVQLSQAWQQEKFNLGVDNMSVWMEEVENILSSQDFGADLAAVEHLIKEHTVLEQDVRTHQDIVDIIVTAAQQFIECGHFDLKTILQRKSLVTDRFENLLVLMGRRRNKLADSLRAHQLFRDIRVEEEWITGKLQMISGRGQDIDTVRALIRETQTILKEMQTHDPHVQKVIQAGYKLAEGHFMAEEIRKRTDGLGEQWVAMKEKAFQRKQSNQLVLLFLFNIKD